MKAQDAPIPIIITNTSVGRPICSAMATKTGTSRAAEAVFEANSVKKIMKAATANITKNKGVVISALATVSPITNEAPEDLSTLDKAIPPPE